MSSTSRRLKTPIWITTHFGKGSHCIEGPVGSANGAKFCLALVAGDVRFAIHASAFSSRASTNEANALAWYCADSRGSLPLSTTALRAAVRRIVVWTPTRYAAVQILESDHPCGSRSRSAADRPANRQTLRFERDTFGPASQLSRLVRGANVVAVTLWRAVLVDCGRAGT